MFRVDLTRLADETSRERLEALKHMQVKFAVAAAASAAVAKLVVDVFLLLLPLLLLLTKKTN